MTSVGNATAGSLVVTAAVPLLLYAVDQALLQVTVTGGHALFAHYGGMAIAAAHVVDGSLVTDRHSRAIESRRGPLASTRLWVMQQSGARRRHRDD